MFGRDKDGTPPIPKKKNCRVTGQTFAISPEEVAAFQRHEVPLPAISPEERLRRLLSFRNDSRFYWRECSASSERIFSAYPPNAPYPVVAEDIWWSDRWDGLQFAQEFDFGSAFFEQLHELWKKAPRPAAHVRDSSSVKASHRVTNCHECFLVWDCRDSTNSFYSHHLSDCQHCADCFYCRGCRNCYECVDCHACDSLLFSEHAHLCSESAFLFNCSKCDHCLFCANLEGCSYYVFNEKVTPEEFERFRNEWELSERARREAAYERFREFLKDVPTPHLYQTSSTNVSGNYIFSSKDVTRSFFCENVEDTFGGFFLTDAKEILDSYGFPSSGLQRVSQSVSVGYGAKEVYNSVECWKDVERLDYCFYCEESSDLFACAGLRGKQYCILNKQYSKNDYHDKRDELVTHLRAKKMWRVSLPTVFSDFAYNQSSANDVMPLNKIQAEMMKFAWAGEDEFVRPSQLLGSSGTSPAERFQDVPTSVDSLSEVDLSQAVFLCELSGKPYQFTQQETELYRRQQVAPPSRSFEQRYRERLQRLAFRGLQEATSSVSEKEFVTSFSKSWPQPVVDEAEWRKLVAHNSRR